MNVPSGKDDQQRDTTRSGQFSRREIFRLAQILGIGGATARSMPGVGHVVASLNPQGATSAKSVGRLKSGDTGYSSPSEVNQPEDRIDVWISGDSLMWGQGLDWSKKFSVMAATRIAEDFQLQSGLRESPLSKNFTPRSGAKIYARTAPVSGDDPILLKLPTGALKPYFDGDRARFYNRFPGFFSDAASAEMFLDGTDESPAAELFGEIPESLPTVLSQIASIPDSIASGIRLLLLNGGANDTDFVGVIDPTSGRSARDIDRDASTYIHDMFLDLVIAARRRCPNAVIIVPGFYLPLSSSSSREDIKELFLYMKSLGIPKRILNDFSTATLHSALPFFDDTDDYINDSLERALFGYGRAMHYVRQAVTELYESEFRGPGIYFAHPGFLPENAAFTRTAFVHDGYKAPGNESHSVKDAALDARRDRFRRLRHIGDIDDLIALITNWLFTHADSTRNSASDLATYLLEQDLSSDWPIAFREKLELFIQRNSVTSAKDAKEVLQEEVGALRHDRIASFLHPNEDGSRRYADAIVAVFERNVAQSVTDGLESLRSSDSTRNGVSRSVAGYLKSAGLDPRNGLKACFQHINLDSVALETVTSVPYPSTGDFRFEVTIRLSPDLEWKVRNLIPPFSEKDAVDIFTVDPHGTIMLNSIVQPEFEIRAAEYVSIEFSSIRLLVNGKSVFDSATTTVQRAGKHKWILPYPN